MPSYLDKERKKMREKLTRSGVFDGGRQYGRWLCYVAALFFVLVCRISDSAAVVDGAYV